MPDVQEVFRMATQEVRPDAGFVDRQHRTQRRRDRNRKIGALTVVGMIALLAATIALRLVGDEPPTQPAQPPPPVHLGEAVFAVDLVTGEPTRIIVNTSSPVDASPDGSQIAYGGVPKSQIFIADADGSHRQQVTNDPDGAEQADWSPDGEQLVYVGSFQSASDRGIYVLDLATGRARQLTEVEGYVANPSWSPDGRTILYTTHAVTSFRVGRPMLQTVDVSTGEVTKLTGRTDGAADADWSPDGSRIAFASDEVTRDLDDVHGIFLMNADGSGIHPLVSDVEAWEPRWSPDGSRIAYFAGDKSGCCSTYVVDVTSGQVHKVALKGIFTTWLDDDTLLVQGCPSCS
jgi:Tol biopolymer transport system component